MFKFLLCAYYSHLKDFVLFSLQVLLVFKVMQLRRRPRIKKRFIGSKTVTPTPLTNRPSPATDQCEINIENCCNMNICETVRQKVFEK